MKPTTFANVLIIGLALTVASTGCKKKPVNPTPLPGARTARFTEAPPSGPIMPPPSGPIGSDIATKPLTDGGIPSNSPEDRAGWPKDRVILQADMVFFDFDSSAVKGSEKAKMAHVVDYLKANPANAVLIEGHCDERGTEEYNRALGDRRANALREELVRLGIDKTRVDTLSLGKDQPLDPGHDSAAWSKNRRGEFIVRTPPGK
jgi:peptidoglycan-associated lipoprotein